MQMDSLQINEYELHDFLDDPNFDQFINLIRGEDEEPVGDGNVGTCFLDPPPAQIDFDFNIVGDTLVPSAGVVSGLDAPEEEDDSSTTINVVAARKTRMDRSRTLVSERKRRGRMKEKLYALRSLVPNITKMDKASIVGDAVLYVEDLQMQAKKLKADIANLEASLAGCHQSTESKDNNVKFAAYDKPPTKRIKQMDVFQVEVSEFYVRLVCQRGEGIAASLYKALESLTTFCIRNSNLVTVDDTFILTFTINVINCEQSLNLQNLKLWVTGALINQGFDFH